MVEQKPSDDTEMKKRSVENIFSLAWRVMFYPQAIVVKFIRTLSRSQQVKV